jgi:14-3-3 protein epsilon
VYRKKIEDELTTICREVLELLDNYLLKQSQHAEGNVFFWKMKGDYYRYLGEFLVQDERKAVIDKAQDSYKFA